jgi:hypothetical protein
MSYNSLIRASMNPSPSVNFKTISYPRNRYQGVLITNKDLNLNDSSTWGKNKTWSSAGIDLGPIVVPPLQK